MSTKTYHVVRQHLGDRDYYPGDTRDALPSDVAHLIPHVLTLDEPEARPVKTASVKKNVKAKA